MQKPKASAESFCVKFGKHMSRIGKTPITVPKDVTIMVTGKSVVVKGPKGELSEYIPDKITVTQREGILEVTRKGEDKKVKSIHGFVRAKIASDITGVTTGWTKTLELSGVGYRANIAGANLVLTIGFSHPVTVTPPNGIAFAVNEGKITVSGIDKHLVGQVAASIRAIKKPEPYKGKGIKYAGEHIRKKAGKAAKAIGGAVGGAAK